MFGNFVQRIQESFSPVTSPVSSPKVSRRRVKSPNRAQGSARGTAFPRQRGPNSRRNHKDEYREVQSEPETENCNATGSRRLLEKRKGKSRPKILEISNPIPIPIPKPEAKSLYFSANDLSDSPCIRSDGGGFDSYGKQNRDKPLSNGNGFHYVNSVPNIVDQGIYESRVNGSRVRNDTRRNGGSGYDIQGGRTNSRIDEFEKTRKENIYWNTGFAPLQGSKSLGRLDGIKEVQRLAQYEQYIQTLLAEGRENEEFARNKTKAKEGVKRGQEESDLERIQDLFPGDALRLYDKDALTMRMKGLMQKRSTAASRLQRALSAKKLEPEEQSLPKDGQDKRVFLLETPVQFTTGVQSQERHLFLFNDLLLVAKARSGGNFKLKEKVRVSEIWMTRCSMEDVIEVHKSQETSFVIGWPTTNVVATFRRESVAMTLGTQLRSYETRFEGSCEYLADVDDDVVDTTCWSATKRQRKILRLRSFGKLPKDGKVDGVMFRQGQFDSRPVSPEPTSSGRKYAKKSGIRGVEAVGRFRRNLFPDKSKSTQATRDLWWNKLSEVVAAEREKEPKSTNIQVLYNDVTTNIEYVKTFSVGPYDTATRCIALALDHLEMRGLDPSDFQLWAKSSREEAPYPLIGHERPFAIKLSCLREGLSTEEGFDLDHCNNVHGPDPLTRCQFILRNIRRTPECQTADPKKERKKSRKSPMRIRQVFRRSINKGDDGVDHCPGVLFGQPLSRVAAGDVPPRPVMMMLQQVFQKGPFTQGIFRKSANARLVRELRDKLDTGEEIQLDVVPVLVTAALLKEFLRSLPEPLLGSHLYPLWLDALTCNNQSERIVRFKSLVEQLSKANQNLLAHFLCVLHHIARKSSLNLMSAGNLGVCVGPSLLWTPSMTPAGSKAVPALVEALVTHCEVIIGPHVPHLLGDPPERLPDSGAEESDSLHSGGFRRDDSSIDSLERELLDPPRKDKMSLSRDSGLTMSDSQLYTPDEEESTSSSSSGSGRGVYSSATPIHGSNYHQHSKIAASYSVPGSNSATNLGPSALTTTPNREYVRVYGGWEERVQDCCRNRSNSIYAQTVRSASGVINPNFQRQDWFRQRSQLKRLNSGGVPIPTDPTTRADSHESLLGDHSKDDCDVPKRPALHGKGRAPQPPPVPTPLPRSKSAHHLCTTISLTESPRMRRTTTLEKGVMSRLHDGIVSRSTPHIDAERSYDSSTLSDDDSTPHVSRSNSRGKDCTGAIEQVYTLCDERLVHAAPAQVTVDPPPVPPKRAPLRHLPPVHSDSVQEDTKPTERRGRLRQRELAHKTAALRSKSLPPPEDYKRKEDGQDWRNANGEVDWTNSNYPCKLPEKSRTRSEVNGKNRSVDSSRTHREEKNADASLPRTVEIPPPYRPPPTVGPLNPRAPITSYHLRDAFSRKVLLGKGDHQEESYV